MSGIKLSEKKNRALQEGMVIPAHPLALNKDRKLNEQYQRALTRYYIASGAGGVAVGVHTTQFEIRDEKHQLFEKVLRMAAEEIERAKLQRPFLKVAGICGPIEQSLSEVDTALSLGYDIGLVSMAGLTDWSEEDHLERIRTIAKHIPVFGFYMQPSIGGRAFSYNFWRQLSDIPGLIGIKIAPFNRYQTIDVVRAVCSSERKDEISIYTGNDDNIINDLLTTYRFRINGKIIEKRIVGGLLGHWACWTRSAVEMLEEIKQVRDEDQMTTKWLTRNIEVTDSNAAFFDSANNFAGCIAGIHEVLRRQGLLQGRWCLDSKEELSVGQMEEINRVYEAYPHLNDDEFVKKHLQNWLSNK